MEITVSVKPPTMQYKETRQLNATASGDQCFFSER